MKISIARLKEIIMEEVAKAAAVEEGWGSQKIDPRIMAKAEPGSPAHIQKCKEIEDKIRGSLSVAGDPEDRRHGAETEQGASEMQAMMLNAEFQRLKCKKTKSGTWMEDLEETIEIVDDE